MYEAISGIHMQTKRDCETEVGGRRVKHPTMSNSAARLGLEASNGVADMLRSVTEFLPETGAVGS